jgi:uncharacterized membrane protein YjfL (UPF0719 family)
MAELIDPFSSVILRLKGLGFFNFLLPFMISSAVFYGLLRKSQIFGPAERNVAVNATVAMGIAFFIWAFPILQGINIEEQLSAFFAQSLVAMLVLMVGVMITGMLLPQNLPELLGEKFKAGGAWSLLFVGGILVGIALLVTSGLTGIFFPAGMVSSIPEDVINIVAVMAFLLITVIIFVGWVGKGEK